MKLRRQLSMKFVYCSAWAKAKTKSFGPKHNTKVASFKSKTKVEFDTVRPSLVSLSFFSIATFDKVVGLICHRHCQKMGWYSDTVVLICHTHCQKIWQGSWPHMSRTLSENGLIQWHGSPILSHTLSENWMIKLSWCVTNIDRNFNKLVVLICDRYCWKIGQFIYLDLCFWNENIIHNTYTYIFYH